MRHLISVMLVVFLPLTLASDTQQVNPFRRAKVQNPASDTQHRFKVYVSVGGEDKTITSRLTSHLKRELRALGDVNIVGFDDDWKYAIRVFYIEHETKSGAKTGFISIASITESRLTKLNLKDHARDLKVVFPGRLYAAYWSTDNLQEWCITAVGSFNDDKLELLRSAYDFDRKLEK